MQRRQGSRSKLQASGGCKMSACYECSLCHQQYSELDPAMQCCATNKAAITGLSGEALMSISQAIRMEERAAIVAWLRGPDPYPDGHDIADAIEAGEHLK